jgi:hypothetical protein
LQVRNRMVPLSLGIRYGFDLDRLPKGFSTLNPYLSAQGLLVFRKESVVGSPILTGLADPNLEELYAEGQSVSRTAFGFNVGGGLEFDVYQRQVFLGVDLRYHVLFWPDSKTRFGNIDRDGNMVTVMGQATFTY